MKTASPALIAYLNTGQQFVLADLFTFSLANGQVYRYTNGQMGIGIPGNLLKYSDQPDNAAWSKVGCSVGIDSAIDPEGTATARSIIESAAAGNHYIYQAATVPSSATDLCACMYFKAGTRTWVRIALRELTGNTELIGYFNTATGEKGAIGVGANWSNYRSIVTDVGGGWYKVQMLARKTNAATTVHMIVMLGTASGSANYTGDGTSRLYAWRGGIVQSANAVTPEQTTDTALESRQFDASSVIIERGSMKTIIGTAADTLELKVYAQPEHLLSGGPWTQAARQGVLDGAEVLVQRLFMPTYGDTSLGLVHGFSGRVADIKIGRHMVKLNVKSDLELLNTEMPRNLFQPGCINTLFDSACGLNRASFAVNSTVSAGSTKTVIICPLTQAGEYFTQGQIQFTSGALNGITVSISRYSPGYITLVGPLQQAPADGDTFTVWPGCPKTQNACKNTNTSIGPAFNNLNRFRAFPYVPQPETIE